MNISEKHIKEIKKLIPKKDQQSFVENAIETGLQKHRMTKQPKLNLGGKIKGALELFTDGGSRGNPGISGGGYAVYKNGKLIDKGCEFFGVKTNNQSEYLALRLGLREVFEKYGDTSVNCYMDSKLAVEQLNGNFKVKNANIKPLFEEVSRITAQFKQFHISHIPREQNTVADEMANIAMDKRG